jgi:hypothetical protein
MRPCRSLLLFFSVCALGAVPYQWEGKAGESDFTLDVPATWRVLESVKRNGVIVQFRKRGGARIEVRSFAAKEPLTIPQIVNQKAARLASEFSWVKLIEEKDSTYRENLHLSVWEIRSGGKSYREETAIALDNSGPVVVSCLIPQELYARYRTHCENAFYSLSLEADKAGPADEKKVSGSLADQLARLYFVHMPGNLPVMPPEALINPAGPNKPSAAPIRYDDNYILPDENNK